MCAVQTWSKLLGASLAQEKVIQNTQAFKRLETLRNLHACWAQNPRGLVHCSVKKPEKHWCKAQHGWVFPTTQNRALQNFQADKRIKTFQLEGVGYCCSFFFCSMVIVSSFFGTFQKGFSSHPHDSLTPCFCWKTGATCHSKRIQHHQFSISSPIRNLIFRAYCKSH